MLSCGFDGSDFPRVGDSAGIIGLSTWCALTAIAVAVGSRSPYRSIAIVGSRGRQFETLPGLSSWPGCFIIVTDLIDQLVCCIENEQ